MFLDPIQKRALSRSVQLEAVYLEALLCTHFLMEQVLLIIHQTMERGMPPHPPASLVPTVLKAKPT